MTTIVAALLLAMPLLAAAQTSGTIDNAPQEMNAETGEDPTPTSIPPTATATHAVITPTATTAPSPTATADVETPTPTTTPSPTATQDVMTPTATATASALPNTDTITTNAETTITLQPGEERELPFTYQVTTLRTSTTIHAELRTTAGDPATGWTLRGQAGPGGWIGDGTSIDLTETDTTTPGSAFTVTFAITAPAEVKEEETVSLFVSSTATTDAGDIEAGITNDAPVATFSAFQSSAVKIQSSNYESNFGIMATANEYTINVVYQGGAPPQGACYTVQFQTSLEGGVVVSALELLGLTSTVNNLLDALDRRDSIGNCSDSTITPTGAVSELVSGLSGLKLNILGVVNLPLNELLGAITITPDITPTNLPGYGTPTVEGEAPFTLQQYKTSGVESTITYTALPPCNPSVSASALSFPESKWTGEEYEPVRKGLGLTVSVSNTDCYGFPPEWKIQVTTGSMTRVDDGTGVDGTIPANAFYYDGTQSSTSLTGISPAASKLQLGTSPVQIATGTDAFTSGQTWNAMFELQPPDAPPGEYTGTITITIPNSGG